MPVPLLHVLCVEVHFAVGIAIAARLRGVASVEHDSDSAVMAPGFDATPYDVVLLCPYIHRAVRARIVSGLLRRNPPPGIVEIHETASGPRVELVCRGTGPRGAIDSMLAALSAARPTGW